MTPKDKLKTETHYSIPLEVRTVTGEFETLDIIQEENVKGRNAIQIDFYKERWRTPEDTIELLKKIIIVLEEEFIKS